MNESWLRVPVDRETLRRRVDLVALPDRVRARPVRVRDGRLGDWSVAGDREWPLSHLHADPDGSPAEPPFCVTRERPTSAELIAS